MAAAIPGPLRRWRLPPVLRTALGSNRLLFEKLRAIFAPMDEPTLAGCAKRLRSVIDCWNFLEVIDVQRPSWPVLPKQIGSVAVALRTIAAEQGQRRASMSMSPDPTRWLGTVSLTGTLAVAIARARKAAVGRVLVPRKLRAA